MDAVDENDDPSMSNFILLITIICMKYLTCNTEPFSKWVNVKENEIYKSVIINEDALN